MYKVKGTDIDLKKDDSNFRNNIKGPQGFAPFGEHEYAGNSRTYDQREYNKACYRRLENGNDIQVHLQNT